MEEEIKIRFVCSAKLALGLGKSQGGREKKCRSLHRSKCYIVAHHCWSLVKLLGFMEVGGLLIVDCHLVAVSLRFGMMLKVRTLIRIRRVLLHSSPDTKTCFFIIATPIVINRIID